MQKKEKKNQFHLPFLTFFRSRGGSFNALMMSEAADGTTEMVAWRFWMVKHTVIFKPFQSPVALAMSSPIFFGDCKMTTELVSFHVEFHVVEFSLPNPMDQFLGPTMMLLRLRLQHSGGRLDAWGTERKTIKFYAHV